MKKTINLILDDEDIIELMRILMDDDAEYALAFLKQHFKGKARDLLEGGWKVMIEVPGAGITQVSSDLFKRWAMHLEFISLLHTLPCLAEPGKIIVVGKPSHALDEVIPYMATLPGVISFNPDTCTLTFRRHPGFLTLYPDKVYITQVKDAVEGVELLSALKDAVNAVWDRREELIAVTTKERSASHLAIWELLPQTNCHQCGEMTCLAFAIRLIQQKRELDECQPLVSDPTMAGHRAALETML